MLGPLRRAPAPRLRHHRHRHVLRLEAHHDQRLREPVEEPEPERDLRDLGGCEVPAQLGGVGGRQRLRNVDDGVGELQRGAFLRRE